MKTKGRTPNGHPRRAPRLNRVPRVKRVLGSLVAAGALVSALPAVASATSLPSATSAAAADDPTPTVHTRANADPRVGALFAPGATAHSCTGTVLDSPSGTLVLTAAHCLSGTGAGFTFAPGWDGGPSAAGVWTVRAAYVPQAWSTSTDPQDDIAVLDVAPRTIDGQSRTIESVTGGYRLSAGIAARTQVRVPAYVAGAGGSQLDCRNAVDGVQDGEWPTFRCDGYAGGVSGSPFLVRGPQGRPEIAAVLGGYQQGGCVNDTSYGTQTGSIVPTLMAEATSGAAPRPIPDAPNDCT